MKKNTLLANFTKILGITELLARFKQKVVIGNLMTLIKIAQKLKILLQMVRVLSHQLHKKPSGISPEGFFF
ncbi:hypothetical protein FHS59_000076 [Algoriphagus iocasae]|uniref:Uncharacterized protein n=1 Tax=Algoriphagus iocasae TaxID=1836499 RepID=A0A841MR03_9BACT|nr:hypothetical protein [Algoriphagus iocasae]MBB6324461.1 hypothetical protein [Algoriphagus iocasae]